MSNPTAAELREGAKAYEALHVPAIFADWTERVLDAAEVRPGHRVLDVACGTGVLARTASRRLGGDGDVIGLDPNPGMLAVAAELGPHIEWKQGAAEALPFPDQAFDSVVSQFGLMFFNDRVGALREMLRVLKPGGVVAVAVWGAVDTMPVYATLADLFARRGGEAAADALRTPFHLGSVDNLLPIFDAAGVDVDVRSSSGAATFPSVRIMVEAELRGWLPVMGVVLEEDVIQLILREAEVDLAPWVATDGRVCFDTTAHIAVVEKPS